MRTSKLFSLLVAAIASLHAIAATAASIDMDDPRRALGREGNVRVDAQLTHHTISPGVPVGVTYQIQNLGASSIAVAAKVADASYDAETRTITLSVGSEVPQDGMMPRMVTIAPGEKKILRAAATPSLTAAALSTAGGAGPRYIRVKVSVLGDLTDFSDLINTGSASPQPLPDELFDKWFESNRTIFLNAVPVRFSPRRGGAATAEQRSARGSF